MRTFLKLFITLLVLAGGFVAYLVLQPASSVLKTSIRPAPQALTRNAAGLLIGEGENAWVRQFDAEGRLASRFRAEKWEPEKNGLVRVTRPEAELILKGGKDKDGREKPRPLVRIRGDDGEVVVRSLPDAASADKPIAAGSGAGARGASAGPAQPPSSGRLNGVIIEVFESESDAAPRVTMRTNNIVFDNDTFRISTEGYLAADGATVAPDEVPVAVTGPDFDFFGRGLTVRWNDLDERLELLRIAHGDRLVIKNVAAFSGAGGLPLGLPKSEDAAAPAARARRYFAPVGMLASADGAAAVTLAMADRGGKDAAERAPAPGAAGTKPARKKKDGEQKDADQPPYRAAFNDGVRIVQGEQQLAAARLLNVDFLLGQRKGDPATTQPATQAAPAATRPTDAREPTLAPPATAQAAEIQPAPGRASSQPTTGPIDAALPITVYWTGELTVTPILTPRPPPAPAATPSSEPATAPALAASPPPATPAGEPPLPPGEARVELIGAPAVLTRDALEVRTARFVYRTDGRLSLDAAPDFPRVLITQKPGVGDGPATTVSTEGLTYARNDQVAALRGDSRVIVPIETGGDGATAAAPGMLDASWRDTATFRLVGEREDQMWVEHAAFAGKVDVKAPQGVIRSERLELTFDPPAGEFTPVPATTSKPRTPAGSTLAERSSDSPALSDRSSFRNRSDSPNLRRIVATDSVYCELLDATEGKRVVECQRLALDTARSGDGELYPRTVDASGGVHATTAGQELNAGHVVLQLKPAKKQAAEPAAPPVGDDAEFALANKGQRVIAGAGTLGLAGGSRPVADTSPAFEMESMTATDAVRIASADGGAAGGKRLHVTVDAEGNPRVELTGDPARVDHGAGGGALTGPLIEIDPKTGVAHVVGPGTLRAVQRDEPEGVSAVVADAVAAGVPSAAGPSRPIEVTWADGAEVRGADDRIEITGAVSVWITDTDGSVRSATAGRVRVELAKKAAENAELGPDARRGVGPGVKPRGAGRLADSMDMDLFKNKEVARVLLHDNAVVNSRLTADDGAMLQQFHLKSETITYDVRSRRLAVPGPGRMLVEIHDPKDAAGDDDGAKQAKSGGAGESAALPGGNGVTAFEWRESMEYDESNGRAAMDGNVVVSHQPDRKGEKAEVPVRLDADALTAIFESQSVRSGRPGAPDAGKNNKAPNLRLRSMNATGGIVISREGADLTAREISYDPADEWVIARGTDRNPATFSAPGGTGTMRAGELWMNTRTWAVKVKDVNTRVGGIGR